MNKKYKLYIFILLIIPYIQLPGYIIGGVLDTIFDLYKVASSILIFIIYIYKYRKMSKMLVAVTLFQFTFVLSTIINGSLKNVFDQSIQFLSVVSICMLAEFGIREDCKSFFKAMCIVLGGLALANGYTMFKYYPNGMYVDELNHWQYYFLGYDNSSFFIEFPLLIYLTCYSYMKNKNIGLIVWLVIGMMAFQYIYVQSTTAIIMIAIFAIFLLTYKLIIWEKFLDFRVVISILLVTFFVIVIFNVQIYFSEFLENIVHKDITLTGRDYIWEEAKKYIMASPIIGYGMENFEVIMGKFGINHVHNFILDILYNGGIIALTMYSFILNLCKRYLNKDRSNFILNTISIGIFIYLFSGIFDYYNNKYVIFTLFILAMYSNKIIENVKETKTIERIREME